MDRLTRILIAVGAIILLVLIAVLIILDKDPTQYVGSITAVIASLTAAGLLGSKLNTVAKNVNGNTSRLLDELERLRANEAARLAAEGAPVPAQNYVESNIDPMTEDTLLRIKAERDKLPKHE